MKSLFIPIHSFVDVITNSSSEIFISADEGTVKAVKELINNLLKGVGSTQTADDLFDIVVGIDIDNPETYEERKISGKGWEIRVPLDSPEGKEQEEENERIQGNGDGYGKDLGIIVTPKDGTNENIVLAAKTLSDLSGLFYMEAYRNG
jgi:hypothetical protein